APDGPVPAHLGVDRDALGAAGFGDDAGSTTTVPADGRVVVAVAAPDATRDTARLAAAGFARATRGQGEIALMVDALLGDAPTAAAQATVAGLLRAPYSFDVLRTRRPPTPLTGVTLVTQADQAAVEAGIERGRLTARATLLARDLANCPHNLLNASDMADVAEALAGGPITVEVFDEDDLVE